MTYKKLYKNTFEEYKNLQENYNKIINELFQTYKYLYPKYYEDLINKYKYLPATYFADFKMNYLQMMRDYHKEQLEKEKMKKLIKECMGEIEVKDPLEPFDWDRGDVILTTDQIKAIKAMGENEL